MGRNRAIVTAFLLCMGIHTYAVEDTCLYDVKLDPWLFGQNAAGLTRYSFANMGMAELSLTKGKGGFTNFYDSPDALNFDAFVESFFRLNSRSVVYGSMSYSNFSGKDMAGSAFIQSISPLTSHPSPLTFNPSHLPFDIVEDSLTNTGTKHQDTYRLTGGVGIDLHKGFSLGARIDYTAANYAKYKDLRHKNKLMDLNLSSGFYLPVALCGSTSLSLGANYLYHRTTESVQFSTYGKNDKVYNSLVSYANFMGHVEQFGSDGYTDRSREMPLVSDYNGIGVQLGLQSSSFSLYNAFSYAHRRGYYGRKSPFTITYTGHESDSYAYDVRLTRMLKRTRHYVNLHLQAENLQNDAANYRELKNDASATYYEYYDPVKTANKLWVEGSVAYTLDILYRSGVMPLWTVQTGMNWLHRKQTAYLYPYYRRQNLTSYEPFVSLCRNIFADKAYWTVMLNASFRQGGDEPYEDLTFQTPSDKQEAPATMEAYLWQEYQWLTAAQYQIGASVKYTFIPPFSSPSSLLFYIRLDVSHRKANETYEYSQGCDHTTASLAIGCNF